MTTALATALTPDTVMSFEINPGTLNKFLEARAESGPRLKCYEGSVTLVSPGRPHETSGYRLTNLVLAVCLELGIEHTSLASTTWKLPKGAKDTAYEADQCYYIQSYGTAEEDQVPDLAIEVVVSHSEKKALLCGALLGIPEMWVIDVPHHRLTFYHLSRRGKHKGTYQPHARSRAFPFLNSAEVLEQLDAPAAGDTAFHQNCRAWAREVLVPRWRAKEGGG